MISSITLNVKVCWWLKLYLIILNAFCMTVGMFPDEDKLSRIIKKGIRLKIRK